MAKVITITSQNGQTIYYPKTVALQVYDDADGITVKTKLDNLQTNKQDLLVSGTNIKTINNSSILGNGNIEILGEKGDDGLDAYQPFKGWFDSSFALSTAYPSPQVGDFAYVKGATSTDPVAIYACATAGTWADSGNEFNPANNQEFASGEALNTVHIVDGLESSSATDVLSAKQGKVLDEKVDALGLEINNIKSGGVGLISEQKTAILNCFRYVAWTTDDGMSLYSALRTAFGYIDVTSITLDIVTLSIDVGDTQQLTATVLPSNVTEEVVWSSSNDSVATVSGGLVTAISIGSANIIATCGGKSATCAVAVAAQTRIPVTGINFVAEGNLASNGRIVLSTGETLALQTEIAPSDATNKNVTWTSSNTSVATVTNGIVSGVSVGTTTITATTVDGGFTASYTISVIAASQLVYNWDFTTSMTDTINQQEATTNGTFESGEGVVFNAQGQYISYNAQWQPGRVYEIEIDYGESVNSAHERLIAVSISNRTDQNGSCLIFAAGANGSGKYGFYIYAKNNNGWDSQAILPSTASDIGITRKYFDGSILRLAIDGDGYPTLYKGNILVGTSLKTIIGHSGHGMYSGSASSDTLANCTVKAFRIFGNNN